MEHQDKHKKEFERFLSSDKLIDSIAAIIFILFLLTFIPATFAANDYSDAFETIESGTEDGIGAAFIELEIIDRDDEGGFELPGTNTNISDLGRGVSSFSDLMERKNILFETDIYALRRTQIDSFRAGYYQRNLMPVPSAIMNWPAHGDLNAGEPFYKAAFRDISQSGTYEPEKGDFPLINGDYMIWWALTEEQIEKLSEGTTEGQNSLFAYASAHVYDCNDPVLYNTIFVNIHFYEESYALPAFPFNQTGLIQELIAGERETVSAGEQAFQQDMTDYTAHKGDILYTALYPDGEQDMEDFRFTLTYLNGDMTESQLEDMQSQLPKLLQDDKLGKLEPCSGPGGSGCTGSDCVWPGDINHDAVVDITDVLYIGLAYGYTGSERQGATTSWVPQDADDWQTEFPSGLNHKFADANGDGIIDANDLDAIVKNYSFQSNKNGNSSSNEGPPLYFSTPPDSVYQSGMLSVPIHLGDAETKAEGIYGISFSIQYDPSVIKTGSIGFDVSESWLGVADSNIIMLDIDHAESGIIDVAVVRTDQSNTDGEGCIIKVFFVTIDNISGGFTKPYEFDLGITNVHAINVYEDVIDINPGKTTLSISELTETNTSIDGEASENQALSIYPVPADDMFHIGGGAEIKIESFDILNLQGQVVYKYMNQSGQDEISVDLSSLKEGVYIIRIETGNELITDKLLISR